MEYASSYIFCTLIFLNFACSLDKISLNLKWFIIRELTNSNYIYVLIKLYCVNVVFRSIINNIYLQKHFKTGSCDVPVGPKGINLQIYLICIHYLLNYKLFNYGYLINFLLVFTADIFLHTWTKYRYKINLSSHNELLPSHTPVFKTRRIMVYQCPTVRPSVCLSVRPFHMSRSNLRTPLPIHFKFHRVIRIDGLTVCILYGEISNFHSRVMGLYSSNCT